ncbi:Nicotianamine synthase 1 [Zostera marina]|uniref:Nicotianamine synthase n=1 Tax=Zostera marina TaxID=29655 RepID=A0A0K9NSC5_ZOSMR|nr:Nicotianamine synthase 1 [Zostera marina]
MGDQEEQQPTLEERSVLDLLQKINKLHAEISKLQSLSPSEKVNGLFTELVTTCIPPSTIDTTKLTKADNSMRSDLINLCGKAEELLERHYSTLLSEKENPLDHLNLFPYYSNYLKLSQLEHTILTTRFPHTAHSAALKVAFIGSGPLPLSSVVLAKHHMQSSVIHNYDVDPLANSLAMRLTSSDGDLSQRMVFHTCNVMDVTSQLKDYDVVFLATLVGMGKDEKVLIIEHLANYMAPLAVLMVRSATGARGFLYPVVDPNDLQDHGFELISAFHPTDEVINSVLIGRKKLSEKQEVCCHSQVIGNTDEVINSVFNGRKKLSEKQEVCCHSQVIGNTDEVINSVLMGKKLSEKQEVCCHSQVIGNTDEVINSVFNGRKKLPEKQEVCCHSQVIGNGSANIYGEV